MSNNGEMVTGEKCEDEQPGESEDCSNAKCQYSQKSTVVVSSVDCVDKIDVKCNLVVEYGLCNNDYYKVSLYSKSVLSRPVASNYESKCGFRTVRRR